MARYRLLILLMLGFLAACATVEKSAPAKDPALLACDELEEVMARLAGVHEARLSYGIVRANPRLLRRDWRFYVIERAEPYAFALPNGAVGVTRGLLNLALNEAQNAGIAAHEVAHVMHAGPERSRLCADLLSTLPAALQGDEAPAQAFIDAVIARELQTPYSLEEETAADRDGLLYVAGAYYTPLGMIRVFERLAGQDKGAESPRFFLVHPPAKDRVAALRQHLAAAMMHYYASRHTGARESIYDPHY